MTIAEVGILTGFKADEESVKKVKDTLLSDWNILMIIAITNNPL